VNPFEYFQKVYCLTANRDYSRAKSEIVAAGVPESAIIHFDGKKFDQLNPISGPNEIWLKAIRAMRSHMEIVRRAKMEELNNVLIFEDDICFYDWKLDILHEAVEALKTIDWKLFYIGYNIKKPKTFERINNSLIKFQAPVKISGLHAYAINAKAYDQILGFDFTRYLDTWLTKKICPHCLFPLMCTQSDKKEIFTSNFKRFIGP
jgi:hypothetical protein